MKLKFTPTKFSRSVLCCAGMAFTALSSADAALLVYYNFDGLPSGAVGADVPVANLGTLGGNGTLTKATGQANVVASGAGLGSGNALQLIPAADGDQNAAAPHINTLNTLASLGITPSMAYTVMVWANFASAAGDNMILGQDGALALPGGESLHLGTRNGNLHTGHWGDDLGPDQSVNVPPGAGWHHVTYTNDGAAGNQSIYLDGALVVGPGAAGVAGAFDTTKNLLIGTSNNGGSFSGQIDELKVYNSLLSASEIQAGMAIPESGSIVLMALAGGFLLRRRR
ncbi:MAG: LamG-like jellyroll fold domain-containing protein [Verrucomicrobiota bacterium]